MVGIFLALASLFFAPVTVEAVPRIALAPTTVRITVKVEPKDTNRGLTVAINGANYYRSSFDPDFVGEESPKIRNYLYELRVPGYYEVIAVLHRTLPDKDERATTTICLQGPETEC